MLGRSHGRSSPLRSWCGSPAHRLKKVAVSFNPIFTTRRQLCVQASKAKSNHSKATKKTTTREKSLSPPEAPEPAPRIDPNSNISVRRQQRYLKQKKVVEAASFRPTPRAQSYTKPKLDAEERAEINRQREEDAANNAAKAAKLKAEKASLINLYGTEIRFCGGDRGSPVAASESVESWQRESDYTLWPANKSDHGDERPPVLLVDAYNVLFAWKQLYPRDMVADMLMEDARFRLEEDLAAYSQLRQVKVVVVYDAMYRASDPAYLDIRRTTRKTKQGQIDVVYCSDQEADTWIVKESIVLKQEKSCPYVVVASGDIALGESLTQHGAFMTPVRMLIVEVKKALNELGIKLKETQLFYGGSSLSQGMSGADLKQLQAMRQRKVDSDRVHAGIPPSRLRPSVCVRLPKREIES